MKTLNDLLIEILKPFEESTFDYTANVYVNKRRTDIILYNTQSDIHGNVKLEFPTSEEVDIVITHRSLATIEVLGAKVLRGMTFNFNLMYLSIPPSTKIGSRVPREDYLMRRSKIKKIERELKNAIESRTFRIINKREDERV